MDEVQQMWQMMRNIAGARRRQLQENQAHQVRAAQDSSGPQYDDAAMAAEEDALNQMYNVNPADVQAEVEEGQKFHQMMMQERAQQQAARGAAQQMGDVEHGLQGLQLADEQQAAQQQQFAEELEQMMANDPSMAEQILMKIKAQAQQAVQNTGQGAAQGIGAIQNLMNKF